MALSLTQISVEQQRDQLVNGISIEETRISPVLNGIALEEITVSPVFTNITIEQLAETLSDFIVSLSQGIVINMTPGKEFANNFHLSLNPRYAFNTYFT